MNALGALLKWLYPDLRPGIDYGVVQHVGQAPRIAFWSASVPQPTMDYLRSKESEFLALPADWRERRKAERAWKGNAPEHLALRACVRELYELLRRDQSERGASAPTWPEFRDAILARIRTGVVD